MKRAKGTPKPANSGRKKGTPNKFTSTVKEMVLATFQKFQDDPQASLESWGKENLTEFYKISSKLIPTEVNAQISEVRVSVDRKNQSTDIPDAQD